jgi:hypothetical protein
MKNIFYIENYWEGLSPPKNWGKLGRDRFPFYSVKTTFD